MLMWINAGCDVGLGFAQVPSHAPDVGFGSNRRHRLDYSITSLARASSPAGMSRLSALAVLRLIASSYFVGACTGKSTGFSPLRTRST